MHDEKAGLEKLGAETRFDFYTIIKKPNEVEKTKIRCQDGTFEKIKISELEFIPNGNIKEILALVAKPNEQQTKIIADSSYHTQRLEKVQKEKNGNSNTPAFTL